MNTRGAWWTGVALLSAALLAPLLITDVPPLLDYPNHLARFVLLAAGPDDPTLGPIFTPHWTIIPNLATDVFVPPLLRLLLVHVAGRCLLGGILLLNLAGVLTLHRALFGRLSFWPLASGLVAYNSGFLLGFLNWQIGTGLAMLFAAAWLTWRERRPVATIAAAAAASVVSVLLSPDGTGVLPGADRQRRGARHVARKTRAGPIGVAVAGADRTNGSVAADGTARRARRDTLDDARRKSSSSWPARSSTTSFRST